MAHFTPNSCERVLDCLYQADGREAYKVSGWGNKTKGYGLKPSEFDNFSECSRSIFYKCKKSLLSQKFITTVKTDKTKRTNHKSKYMITLLGIAKLFQDKPIGITDFKNIVKILAEIDTDVRFASPSGRADDEEADYNSYLGLWYSLANKKKPADTSEAALGMFEGIRPSLLCQVLDEVLRGIEIIVMNGSVETSFSLNMSKYIRVTLWKFKLENDAVGCIWSPESPRQRERYGDPAGDDWTLQDFYFYAAGSILESMWYVLSKYHSGELPRYLVEGITEQDKTEGTGPIDDFMDILNSQVAHMSFKV